jgi:acyl-CoA thioesterase-1
MRMKFHYKLPFIALPLLLSCTAQVYLNSQPQKNDKQDTVISTRNAPIVYVALGDSTGIGLGARNGDGYVDLLLARMQQTHSGSRLINLSTAWATTADVLNKHLKRFPSTQATLVTVGIGINDLAQGVSDEQFAKNYEQIISYIEKTGVKIIIINLPDISVAPAISSSAREDAGRNVVLFNKRIAEIANRHRLPLVDLYQASSAVTQSHPEFFSADGFHPSDKGYKFWADAMWPMMEKVINE